MKKISVFLGVLIAFALCFAFLSDLNTCKDAVLRAILICANAIIPSLFPYTLCVLFIINTGVFSNNYIFKKLGKLFSLTSEEFCVFFFSLFSGYPTGAKMLNELLNQNKTTQKRASIMLLYSINAGPAFIISAVGVANFGSEKIGVILFVSHVFSSIVLALASKFLLPNEVIEFKNKKDIGLIDNFIISTAQASSSIISICFYIIFFSILTSYMNKAFPDGKIVLFFSMLLEVTLGIKKSKNIYLASFILGFSGFCVIMQVLSVSKDIKSNKPLIVLFRVIHGALSVGLTMLLIKITNTHLPVISNNIDFSKNLFYNGFELAGSLVILSVFFILCVGSKKISGNLVEDLL